MTAEMTGEATEETIEGGVNRGIDMTIEAGPTRDAVISGGISTSSDVNIFKSRADTILLDML